MTGGGVAVTGFQKQGEGPNKELKVSFQNQSQELFYDFVSFYSGQRNVDTELLDLKPGEVKEITLNVQDMRGEFKISTNTVESGVIFREGQQTDPEIKTEANEPQRPQEKEIDGPEGPEKRPERDFNSESVPDLSETVQEMKEETLEPEEKEVEDKSPSIIDSLLHPFGENSEDKSSEDSQESPDQVQKPEVEETDEEEEKSITEKNNYSADRVTTGVINLDNKVEGGFVKGTMNLITGKTGTGKTAFCSNFIWEGAKKGEPGVYVTTEERQEDILEDINSMFGWDFDSLEEQDKVRVLSIKPVFPSQNMDNLSRVVRSYISDLLDQVNEAIEDIDADRVVIDSVSLVQMFIQDEYMSRVALSSLMNNLREAGVTAVLVGSIPETSEGLSKQGIIEYLVDTVILLEFVPVAEDYNRTLKIRKMRRTDHETDIFPFEVTADGLKVYEAYESV